MFENKKTIAISTLLAVVLLIGAFLLGSWNERRILMGLMKNQSSFGQQGQTKVDENFSRAVASNDVKGCDSLATQQKKDQCKKAVISKQAFEKKDVSVCGQMQNKNDADECVGGIAYSAAAEGEISSCDAIPDDAAKAGCVFNAWNSKAVKAKDASICEKIAEQYNKDLCKENVADAQ